MNIQLRFEDVTKSFDELIQLPLQMDIDVIVILDLVTIQPLINVIHAHQDFIKPLYPTILVSNVKS